MVFTEPIHAYRCSTLFAPALFADEARGSSVPGLLNRRRLSFSTPDRGACPRRGAAVHFLPARVHPRKAIQTSPAGIIVFR